eukprot:scaffold3400_cov169-Amphora_coffeaeformis.AAC.18
MPMPVFESFPEYDIIRTYTTKSDHPHLIRCWCMVLYLMKVSYISRGLRLTRESVKTSTSFEYIKAVIWNCGGCSYHRASPTTWICEKETVLGHEMASSSTLDCTSCDRIHRLYSHATALCHRTLYV